MNHNIPSVLCTLYNSLYLDKGLVLYDSLCECAKDFKLYVLCMDDKCYEVLTDLHQKNHIPIRLSDFEAGDEGLLKAKGNRSTGEYCWTCSSSFIRYVLRYYKEPICTYIDADMYFYNDPQILVDEMRNAGKSVMVVPHRFPKGKEAMENTIGKYCVEFNTFVNNSEGLQVLEYWRNRCLECCSILGDGIHWGDQKYLEELVDIFDCVHVCAHPGAGVASWNVEDYCDYDNNNGSIKYENDNEISLIFFHYASLTYRSKRIIDTGVVCTCYMDYRTVDNLYRAYLSRIDKKKVSIKMDYGVNTLIKKHPSATGKLTLRQRITSSYFGVIIRSFFPRMNMGHSYIVRL